MYQDKFYNIISMIHLKNVFLQIMQKTKKLLNELVCPIIFIPESVKVNQLFKEFYK